MASANPNAIVASCPLCGAHYDFPPSMAGRRGRCAKCNEPFTVPAPQPERVPLEEMPQYIGVDCRLCGTRFYGGPDQVGKELKCPDCGTRTVLPPPPKPQPKRIPAAMFGEQYELWEPDEAVRPAELAAHQPKFIAVKCRKCDTLMYATEKQVGDTLRCPDCGMKHVVPAPAKPKVKASVLAPDAETPRLDPAAAPGERPVLIPPRAKMEFEQQQEAEYARAVEESRRTGKPMRIDVRGRPIMPRWPLVKGILPFFFSPGVAERWVALSAGYMFGGYLISEALIWGGMGGLAAMSALMFFIAGMVLCLLLSAAGASMFRAVVIESSEGNNVIQNWNTRYIAEWFPELLYLLMALFASVFPGWAISKAATGDVLISFLPGTAGAVLCFPIVYLSQLHINSPWAVLSGRVLVSVGRCPGSWLLFYLETVLLWTLCVAAVIIAIVMGWHPIVPIPLCIAAAVLYSRLLGRLAWKLAETMSGEP